MTSVGFLQKPLTAFELAREATFRSGSFPRCLLFRGLYTQQFGSIEQILWSPSAQLQQKKVGGCRNADDEAFNIHGRSITNGLGFPCTGRKKQVTSDGSGGDWDVKTDQAGDGIVEIAFLERTGQPVMVQGNGE